MFTVGNVELLVISVWLTILTLSVKAVIVIGLLDLEITVIYTVFHCKAFAIKRVVRKRFI